MPHFGSAAGRTLAGRVFRGINAAASLKREAIGVGFIEAEDAVQQVFRSVIAAASLKHVHPLVLTIGVRRVFPQHQCCGLIEVRLAWGHRPEATSGLPRQRCRGLIEVSEVERD
jgi:hypothetical protein